MVREIKHQDYINEKMAEYYIESMSDLDDIPETALEGTVAMMNSSDGLKIFMKDSEGNWNEI